MKYTEEYILNQIGEDQVINVWLNKESKTVNKTELINMLVDYKITYFNFSYIDNTVDISFRKRRGGK